MSMQSFEDWLIGAASAAAVAGVFAAHALTTPIVSDAVAAEKIAPDYRITVTAKRLPAICKTDRTAAVCADAGLAEETLSVR
jgi:Flp pilus assembly protein CpaB